MAVHPSHGLSESPDMSQGYGSMMADWQAAAILGLKDKCPLSAWRVGWWLSCFKPRRFEGEQAAFI
jgi:hypothetical protein